MTSNERKTDKALQESAVKNLNIGKINPRDIIFSLDIGTRSVVGILGFEKDGVFHIIDSESMQHKSRAMMDGQIHDISRVAEVVEIIKERLESRTGFELSHVAIAAAGRVLKTCAVKVDRKLEPGMAITKEMVNSLELEGIQLAQAKLQEEVSGNDTHSFYCVGHSIVNYYLNGYIISNLVGHKGKSMSANVLATFLPHTVVDSLHSVMEHVGLKISSMTLEPIAAINVSIPNEIRLLNIALVDIGAGTSDVAITRDGSVVAYGMCPVAGDEITEKIAQQYLLDFNTAEQVKIELEKQDKLEFEDIMGIKIQTNASQVVGAIEPAVKHLVDVIAEKIISCNGKAPNAVICIGGGSHTPGLTRLLAERLELPSERVGVRGMEIIKDVSFDNLSISGPEAITPIGIAMTALQQKGHDFIYVKVNKKRLRLFNAEKVVVGDALAVGEFAPEQLIPRSGKPITIELNGKQHSIRSGYGKAAKILVNNTPASLDTPIKNGDIINIVESEGVEEATPIIEDVVHDCRLKKILFNGHQLDVTTLFVLNGEVASPDQPIKDGDKLEVMQIKTVKDLAQFTEINTSDVLFFANAAKVDESYIIRPDDVIITVPKGEQDEADEADEAEPAKVIDIEPIDEETVEVADDQHENVIAVSVNEKVIKLYDKEEYIFIDIFNAMNFDMSQVKGNIAFKLNGERASFTDVLKDGDIIEISHD